MGSNVDERLSDLGQLAPEPSVKFVEELGQFLA
jgi:hypothetical protein